LGLAVHADLEIDGAIGSKDTVIEGRFFVAQEHTDQAVFDVSVDGVTPKNRRIIARAVVELRQKGLFPVQGHTVGVRNEGLKVHVFGYHLRDRRRSQQKYEHSSQQPVNETLHRGVRRHFSSSGAGGIVN